MGESAFLGWPLLRQVTGRDRLGRGQAARSDRSATLSRARSQADQVVDSVCPYCAVGCAQKVYRQGRQGHSDRGQPGQPRLTRPALPQGQRLLQLVTSPTRVTQVRYRRAHGTAWEDLDLDTAMDMIADRVIKTRKEFWEWEDDQGRRTRRTLGIASLGGATLDNEENYLMKKLYTAMGAIQIENQARI